MMMSAFKTSGKKGLNGAQRFGRGGGKGSLEGKTFCCQEI